VDHHRRCAIPAAAEAQHALDVIERRRGKTLRFLDDVIHRDHQVIVLADRRRTTDLGHIRHHGDDMTRAGRLHRAGQMRERTDVQHRWVLKARICFVNYRTRR
jgi:hypothetical protein